MAIRTAVNRALTAITALPTAAALANGNLTLLTTATASSSATLDFTSGIDDTYDSYVFTFKDIHPATNDVQFEFNLSVDSGSNYNVTKTSTFFFAYHNEADSAAALTYSTDHDLAQSTAFQRLSANMGNNNDDNLCGNLTIYNPSSTVFVKHFIANNNHNHQTSAPANVEPFVAGYGNTQSAVNAVQFKFDSGNFDGVIKLYGVS